MTGDAPQPGEPSRDDGSPWSPADPAAPWWRADERDPGVDSLRAEGRRATPAAPPAGAPSAGAASATPTLDPPQPARHSGEAAEAHRAGAQDVRAALTGEAPRQTATEPAVREPERHEPGSREPERREPGSREPGNREPGNREPAAPRHARPQPAKPHPTPHQPTHHELTGQQPAARQPTPPQQAAPPQPEPHQPTRKAASDDANPTRTAAAGAAPANAGEPSASAKTTEAPGSAKTGEPPAIAEAGEPPATTKATEQDHDRVDAERFNTAGAGTVYMARSRVEPAEPQRETAIVDVLGAVPAEPPAEVTPEVMVLPEPDRNRPTVALDRNAVPGQSPTRLGRTRLDPARADRALQDRVRQERTAALLETSPFWKAEEERRALSSPPAEIPAPDVRKRTRRHAPQPRRPAGGLFGLLALGLIAAFFAWVSAEPFWLAVGHGDRGSATVTRCTGSGVTQRCTGQFIPANGAYRVDRLALFGVEPGQRAPGTSSPARMVSSESRQAYVGSTGVLMHLRWALSFVLVLLCGLGIAVLTGARRLDTARARRGALLVSMAGPLALLAGFLYVTY